MITKDSIAFVTSDVSTQFTDSLGYYASEYEDLDLTGTAGLGGEARCYVTSIRLLASQNNAWTVSFHDRASTYDSVIGHLFNNNTMIDFWPFVATDAQVIGTSYVYSVSGMAIPYKDRDNTGRLHVAVHNLSTTAKIQGTGFLQLKIGVKAAA